MAGRQPENGPSRLPSSGEQLATAPLPSSDFILTDQRSAASDRNAGTTAQTGKPLRCVARAAPQSVPLGPCPNRPPIGPAPLTAEAIGLIRRFVGQFANHFT
jgi:hypothetical protein